MVNFCIYYTVYSFIKDSCQNCSNMLEKLEEKTQALRENENQTAELVSLLKKFQSQINLSEELLKITSGNKLKGDSVRKPSPVLSKTKSKK